MFLVPFGRQANELSRGFERLFDDGFDRFFNLAPAGEPGSARSPALDVAESDSAFTVKLDLPGVTKDDVKVSIEGRRVSIDAQTKKEEEKKEGDRVVYRERSMSSWSRSFNLPSEVNSDEAGAKLENGVLTLTLPKRAGTSTAQVTVS